MTKIVRYGLNPRTTTMVSPKHCLYNYYRDVFGEREYPFERFCEKCEYHNGKSECRYEIYKTEAATGDFTYSEDDEDETHYVQWGCAGCGELIRLEDSISYIYHNLITETHVCSHCGTVHRCLDYDDEEKYTFAIPVKETGKELP